MLGIRAAIQIFCQIFWLTLLAGVVPGSAGNNRFPDPAIAQIRALCETAKTGQLTAEKIAGLFARPLADITIIHNNQNRFDAVVTIMDTRMMISVYQPGAGTQRTRLRAEPGHERRPAGAAYFVMMDSACKTENARLLTYDGTGIPAKLIYYTGEPLIFERMEPLNPDVPSGTDPGGVAIALVDAGVNYTLPEIAARLARTPDGQIYGQDLSDHDGRPFDLDPSGSPLFPRRHGTGVASLMMREAPDARLIPIRYPGKNSRLFAQIVDIVAAGPARIVAMPLGGKTRDDWVAFAEVAARHPDILFVVSAGNNGRDIDVEPIFPASFENENFLVATSVDNFGRLPRESNWGPLSVDLAVPAEMLDVTDHRGASVRASGTSYAVPRVAALAARISAAHPDWSAGKIKNAILRFAILLPRRGNGKTRYGWLPNPAAVGPGAPQ